MNKSKIKNTEEKEQKEQEAKTSFLKELWDFLVIDTIVMGIIRFFSFIFKLVILLIKGLF